MLPGGDDDGGGPLVAYASHNLATVVDARRRRVVRCLGPHPARVTALTVLAGGSGGGGAALVICGCDDGSARAWDAMTGACVRAAAPKRRGQQLCAAAALPPPPSTGGRGSDGEGASSNSSSSGGGAVLFGDAGGALLLWRPHGAGAGRLEPLGVALPGRVVCLATAPAGADGANGGVGKDGGGEGDSGVPPLSAPALALAGCADGSITCVDCAAAAGAGAQLWRVAAHNGAVQSLHWASAALPGSSAQLLLSGGEDGRLQLWRLKGDSSGGRVAPPAPVVFCRLPKTGGGGGARSAAAHKPWAAARVLPGSIRADGGCAVVAGAGSGALLLYELAPGRAPGAPAAIRGAHGRAVFQIEVLPSGALGGSESSGSGSGSSGAERHTVASISQDRYFAVTLLPHAAGATGAAAPPPPAAAAAAKGSDADSWRPAGGGGAVEAPQQQQQPQQPQGGRVAWRIAGLGGYVYCCAATASAASASAGAGAGAPSLLAAACGDKTIRIVALAGAGAGDGASAGADGATTTPPPAPRAASDGGGAAAVVWQGLHDKALSLDWLPPPAEGASGAAPLLAYGAADGRVGVVAAKAAAARPFARRHAGPATHVSWRRRRRRPLLGHDEDGSGSAGGGSCTELYSLGGEGCVLRWPEHEGGDANSSSGAGGGGEPADVSACLDEAWRRFQESRGQAEPADGAGSGSSAAAAAAARWTAIAWHADGQLLAAGTNGGAVALFEERRGAPEAGAGANVGAGAGGAQWAVAGCFESGAGLPITQLRWSADSGGLLAAADQWRAYVCRWGALASDAPADEPEAAAAAAGEAAADGPGRLHSHRARVLATPRLDARSKGVRDACVAANAGGDSGGANGLLCVARGDGVVDVWAFDAALRAPLRAAAALRGHTESVQCLCAVPGRPGALVSGSADQSLRGWALGAAIAAAAAANAAVPLPAPEALAAAGAIGTGAEQQQAHSDEGAATASGDGEAVATATPAQPDAGDDAAAAAATPSVVLRAAAAPPTSAAAAGAAKAAAAATTSQKPAPAARAAAGRPSIPPGARAVLPPPPDCRQAGAQRAAHAAILALARRLWPDPQLDAALGDDADNDGAGAAAADEAAAAAGGGAWLGPAHVEALGALLADPEVVLSPAAVRAAPAANRPLLSLLRGDGGGALRAAAAAGAADALAAALAGGAAGRGAMRAAAALAGARDGAGGRGAAAALQAHLAAAWDGDEAAAAPSPPPRGGVNERDA